MGVKCTGHVLVPPYSYYYRTLPLSLQRGLKKRKTAVFRCKIALRLKKVCYKVSLCENCQRQSCKAFIGLTIRAKMTGEVTPSTLNCGSKWPRWSEIADFLSIFARSASVVAPSEKSSINTNRKSTMRFPMSPRWTSNVVPKPPKRAQKRSVQNLNNKLR